MHIMTLWIYGFRETRTRARLYFSYAYREKASYFESKGRLANAWAARHRIIRLQSCQIIGQFRCLDLSSHYTTICFSQQISKDGHTRGWDACGTLHAWDRRWRYSHLGGKSNWKELLGGLKCRENSNKERVWTCGLDSSGSEQGLVIVSCKRGSENSGSITRRKLINDYQLLKINCSMKQLSQRLAVHYSGRNMLQNSLYTERPAGANNMVLKILI